MQKIKQLEGITNAIEAGSRVMSQASATQQRAAEREAKENLLGRQATLIDDQRQQARQDKDKAEILGISGRTAPSRASPGGNRYRSHTCTTGAQQFCQRLRGAQPAIRSAKEGDRASGLNDPLVVAARMLHYHKDANIESQKCVNQPRHTYRCSKAPSRGRSTSQSGTAPATSVRQVGEATSARGRESATEGNRGQEKKPRLPQKKTIA